MLLHKLKKLTLITAVAAMLCSTPCKAQAMHKIRDRKPEIKLGLIGAGMAVVGFRLMKSDLKQAIQQLSSKNTISLRSDLILFSHATLCAFGLSLFVLAAEFWNNRLHELIASENFIGTWILIKLGADVNEYDKKGKTPLSLTIENGHNRLVELLIKHGADVNKRDRNGTTPLLHAIFQNQLTIAKKLLHAGAEVDAINPQDRSEQQTPLMFACEYGYTELVDELLKHSAQVNMSTKSGRTALMLATMYGRHTIVQKLLQTGANINAINSYGRTALMWPIENSNVQIVKTLLAAGADVFKSSEQLNHETYTAFDAAQINFLDSKDLKVRKQEIQRLLRFYVAKQEIKPQAEHLLERKKAAALAREVIEEQAKSSGSQAGATDIAEIIKSYL